MVPGKQRGSDTRDVFCWLDALCTTHHGSNEHDVTATSVVTTPRASMSTNGQKVTNNNHRAMAKQSGGDDSGGESGGSGGGNDGGYREVFSRAIRECGHTLAVLNYTAGTRFMKGHRVASRNLLRSAVFCILILSISLVFSGCFTSETHHLNIQCNALNLAALMILIGCIECGASPRHMNPYSNQTVKYLLRGNTFVIPIPHFAPVCGSISERSMLRSRFLLAYHASRRINSAMC